MLCRILRKRSSVTLIMILLFSVSLLRTVKKEERIEVLDEEEEEEGEEEYITPNEVLDALGILDKAVSTVEAPCTKMVRLGGRVTCSREKNRCAFDGAKLVCLDPDVLPPPGHCMSLNFGIGYEFTFDEALVNYGCRVIALDPTNNNMTNMVYQANLTNALPTPRPPRQGGDSRAPSIPRRTFHALNLGLAKKDNTLLLNLTEDGTSYRGNIVTFFTLRSILHTLDNPRIDLLKIDIEGVEWGILHEVLNAPDATEVLQHVRQILMEVHFDFLKPSMSADEVLRLTWKAIKVLRRLKDLGFHLASSDLNTTAQVYMTFGKMKLAMFREITLIRRRPTLR